MSYGPTIKVSIVNSKDSSNPLPMLKRNLMYISSLKVYVNIIYCNIESGIDISSHSGNDRIDISSHSGNDRIDIIYYTGCPLYDDKLFIRLKKKAKDLGCNHVWFSYAKSGNGNPVSEISIRKFLESKAKSNSNEDKDIN